MSLFLLAAFLVLAVVLLVMARTNDHQTTPMPATEAALRTEVAGQRAQVAAQQTEIAQQQQRIIQLQRIIVAAPNPTAQQNGQHGYLASFQIDKYSYVLYLEWVESRGFIRDGRLLTTDNYVRKGAMSFQLGGVNNNGSYGFTLSDKGSTMTFSGTVNSNGTLTVSGLPWHIFYGFVGNTFSQTLHAGTQQDYQDDVANLANPPQ